MNVDGSKGNCDFCMNPDAPDEGCVFPYYGVAPHVHEPPNGRPAGAPFDASMLIGSTRIVDKKLWPANFREDPAAPGCGTYTHCPICGRGEEKKTT